MFGPDIDIPPVSQIIQSKGDYFIVEQHPNKEQEEATYERVPNVKIKDGRPTNERA